jgi:glycerophosphoryl diester phosphodiesterase
MGPRAALAALALVAAGGCSDARLRGASAVSNGNLDDDLRAPITTCFRFAGSAPFAPLSGPGQLELFDPKSSHWADSAFELGSTGALGIPPLPDGGATVLHLPPLGPTQGLVLRHGTAGNGDFATRGRVSRYTLVFDVYFPPRAAGRLRALYQADAANRDNADFFVSDGGGVGVDGDFEGSVDDGRWHRIAVVVRADPGQGQLQKYVDGTFVGAQGLAGAPIDDRWALGETALLFTDDDGETGEVYVASLLYIGEALLLDEVRALGGPTVRGACQRGMPGAAWPVALPRHADIFGHKGDSGRAPEHTLRAITQALDAGATFIEIDLRRTADGVAVAMHDSTVDRTTNGSGDVAEFTRARLRFLDGGSWFHPTFTGEQIPSLAEVLAVCKGRARVYLDGVRGEGDAIRAAMEEADVGPEAVWPWALDQDDLDELRENIEGVEILYGDINGWEAPGFFERQASEDVTGFSIPYQDLTPDFAAAAHAHGMYVEVYTLFDPEHMIDVVSAGADGMETDYPTVLRELEPAGTTP